jgi:hypothetical protein
MVVVSKHLSSWEIQTFGNVKRELKGLKEELERLRLDSLRTGLSHKEIKTIDKIVELNHREEVMWKQRSHVYLACRGRHQHSK